MKLIYWHIAFFALQGIDLYLTYQGLLHHACELNILAKFAWHWGLLGLCVWKLAIVLFWIAMWDWWTLRVIQIIVMIFVIVVGIDASRLVTVVG